MLRGRKKHFPGDSIDEWSLDSDSLDVHIDYPPPPLTRLSRRGDKPGYGVTAGPVGNRQKVVVNILATYEGIIIT